MLNLSSEALAKEEPEPVIETPAPVTQIVEEEKKQVTPPKKTTFKFDDEDEDDDWEALPPFLRRKK